MGGLGDVNPNTGEYSHGFERAWSGITGKHPPTAPRLPQGFGWLPGMLQNLSTQGMHNLDFGPSNAAGAAGMLGTAGQAGLAGGINLNDVLGTFGSSLGSVGEGAQTGFLPSVDSIDALLRPGLERSFERGSAALRDQNALTGNLTSSGASQQIADFRGGLEANLNNEVAGVLQQAIPQSMQIRSGLSQFGTSVPGLLSSSLYGPLASQGLQGQQFPLQAVGLASSALSGAPFFANQGSSGNGLVPAIASAYIGRGAKGGGGGTGGSPNGGK